MPSQDEWMCKSCVGRDGKPWRNFGHRDTCFKCNLKKGVCFKFKATPKEPSFSMRPTFAEKQVASQKEVELKKREAELKKREYAIALQETKLKDAAAESAALAPGQPVDDTAMEEAEAAGSGPSVEALREFLEAAIKLGGEEDPAVAPARRRLDEAIAKRDAAKPLASRAREAEAKLRKKDEQIKKAQTAHEVAEKALQAARDEVAKTEKIVAERKEERKLLEASLVEIRQRQIAEAPNEAHDTRSKASAALLELRRQLGDRIEAGLFQQLEKVIGTEVTGGMDAGGGTPGGEDERKRHQAELDAEIATLLAQQPVLKKARGGIDQQGAAGQGGAADVDVGGGGGAPGGACAEDADVAEFGAWRLRLDAAYKRRFHPYG